MRPILEAWIETKEEEHRRGNKFTKKRRKRTSFSAEYIHALNGHFAQNPKPTPAEMQAISEKMGLDFTTVKVWFCNKKQSLKRLGQPVQRHSVREELSAKTRKMKTEQSDMTDVFPLNSSHGAQLKTLLPVSTPTGTVTMPFYISQDGNAIPIVTGNTSAGVQGSQNSGSSSNTLTQQIVHLSQLPLLAPMAVVNNGMNDVDESQGSRAILSNGRIIHPNILQQNRSNTNVVHIATNDAHLQQHDIEADTSMDGNVMLTSSEDMTEDSQTLTVVQQEESIADDGIEDEDHVNDDSLCVSSSEQIDDSTMISEDVETGGEASPEVLNRTDESIGVSD